MIQQKHRVRILLTDECTDTLDEVIYGDGSSLGPTFDKIQNEAIRYDGNFDSWEPLRCDFLFPSKDAAHKFINIVKEKFKDQVILEYFPKNNDKEEQDMRAYKKLPKDLDQKLAALTPKSVYNLQVQIHNLENTDCLLDPTEEQEENGFSKNLKLTHVNLKSRSTGKIRSKLFCLRPGKDYAISALESLMPIKEYKDEINKAKKSGWTTSDIAYDSMVNGLMVSDITKGMVNGKECPEIFYACDKVVIVVHDYEGSQFIGWFFYNSNIDEVLHFTGYSL